MHPPVLLHRLISLTFVTVCLSMVSPKSPLILCVLPASARQWGKPRSLTHSHTALPLVPWMPQTDAMPVRLCRSRSCKVS